MSPSSLTTSTTQRLPKSSSNNNLATRCHRTCMTRNSTMRPWRKRLSSPLFILEREEPANLRQAYHSHEESLLPAQSLFSHRSTERPVILRDIRRVVQKTTKIQNIKKESRAGTGMATQWIQSYQNSRRLLPVTLKFETKILRSDKFAQVNLVSAAATLQNVRISLRKRQNGKKRCALEAACGGWPKISSKVKEKDKAAVFLPSENRCLPAPSTLKP